MGLDRLLYIQSPPLLPERVYDPLRATRQRLVLVMVSQTLEQVPLLLVKAAPKPYKTIE